MRYSFKSFKKLFKKYNIEYTKEKLKNYLIIASIIQKEAGNKKEMPLISSVIYNRLKRGMRLQMDGSLNYGRYSHTKVTPERIKSDKSYYNTYKHKGIPKEPICNISILALESAIAPAKTDYLYFFKRDIIATSLLLNIRAYKILEIRSHQNRKNNSLKNLYL